MSNITIKEQGDEFVKNPTFENITKLMGSINEAVYRVNPYSVCPRCDGTGMKYVSNGTDDYDKEVCGCQNDKN
jgi:hypothetical protein